MATERHDEGWVSRLVAVFLQGNLSVLLILVMLVIFAAIVAAIALGLLSQLWHRAIVLEGHALRAAVRRGWQLLRQRLGDVVLMGLMVFALGLVWAIVLVPVVFLLLAVAAVGGGLPALLAYAATSLATEGAVPWIAALVVGLPIFIVIMALPLAILGGLARFRTVLKPMTLGWILVSQVFPTILVIIPLFIILKQLGLLDALPGLTVVYVVFTLPFCLWMLIGFVSNIPRELEEAGAMDGAGRLRILVSIVFPLLRPGVVATALFAFISS